MTVSPNESITPQQAAAMLQWLRDMGADEVLAEATINRFAEPARPHTPSTETIGAAPQAEGRAPKSTLPADISVADTHAKARAATSLSDLARLLAGFLGHPLRATASNLCFFSGAAEARVLVIVDRPRNEEDRNGLVLADRHELLVERMLAAIGLRAVEVADREQVALLSFIPWRPPGNRPPNELECRMILPFAERAIQLLSPKLILSLGALPGQWLAGGNEAIQKQRGRWMNAGGVPMISTFHPETLLKSPGSKRLAWHDLLALREKLDSLA